MTEDDHLGLQQFLIDYPKMAIRPSSGVFLRLRGTFEFIGDHPKHGQLRDAYLMQIDVPPSFPWELPSVTELGGRIPKRAAHHVHGGGTLCLGSPLRLLKMLATNPTLGGFAAQCIIPYLFATTWRANHGGGFVFGELEHEGAGLLTDYGELLGLRTQDQALRALRLLALKKRLANKMICPCGCGIRLGRCRFNRRLAPYRRLASRTWYKRQIALATSQ